MPAPWLLRVASHPRHGGGHLARMTVLGAAMRDAGQAVRFVLDAGADAARARLTKSGFDSVEVAAPDFRHNAGSWSGCVLDGYDILGEETVFWRNTAAPVVVLDDFLDPPLEAALVINGAPHCSGTEVAGIPALLGADFALVDPRYAALSARDRATPVLHVLVAFGKLDPDNLAATAVQALARMSTDRAVSVVAAAASPHLDAIRQALDPLGARGALLLDTPDMIAALSACDFAIGAGGVSLLERMAAGVPSLTLSIADNQRLFVEGAAKRGGTVDGGSAADATPETLSVRLDALLFDSALLQRLSRTGRRLIDGKGARRVAAHLSQLSGQPTAAPALRAAAQ